MITVYASILDSILKMFVIVLSKASDDQVQNVIERYERRIEWIENLFKDELSK